MTPGEQILALHDQGLSVVTIARQVGRKHSHVYEHLTRNNRTPITDRKSWTNEEREEVVDYADEHGLKTASEEYGVHIATISGWRKLFNPVAQPVALPEVTEWAPHAWRLVVIDTLQYLWPRCARLPIPEGAICPPVAHLYDTTLAAYGDGGMSHRLRCLTIPPALVDELSGQIAGNHQAAAGAMRGEMLARLGKTRTLSPEQCATAVHARWVLQNYGLYDHAPTAGPKAAVCDVVLRSILGVANEHHG